MSSRNIFIPPEQKKKRACVGLCVCSVCLCCVHGSVGSNTLSCRCECRNMFQTGIFAGKSAEGSALTIHFKPDYLTLLHRTPRDRRGDTHNTNLTTLVFSSISPKHSLTCWAFNWTEMNWFKLVSCWFRSVMNQILSAVDPLTRGALCWFYDRTRSSMNMNDTKCVYCSQSSGCLGSWGCSRGHSVYFRNHYRVCGFTPHSP